MEKEWSPSLFQDGEVVRCKSENHVPNVAVCKEPRVPDVSSKVSADPLHFRGVQAHGDRSHHSGFNLSKKASLVNPSSLLPTHTMSWWNNLQVSRKKKQILI